jgi:hypothetical protein
MGFIWSCHILLYQRRCLKLLTNIQSAVTSRFANFLNILMLSTLMIYIVLPRLDLHNNKNLVNTGFTYIPDTCGYLFRSASLLLRSTFQYSKWFKRGGGGQAQFKGTGPCIQTNIRVDALLVLFQSLWLMNCYAFVNRKIQEKKSLLVYWNWRKHMDKQGGFWVNMADQKNWSPCSHACLC